MKLTDSNEMVDDIQTLRSLHIEMDQAVAIAYGWQDLDLGHGFHQTKQVDRFTISETARRAVLEREARCRHWLLELNHQRDEEGAQGLYDRGEEKDKATDRRGKFKADVGEGS